MPIPWSESLALEIIGIQTRSLASSLNAAATYSLVIPGKTPLSSKRLFLTSVCSWHTACLDDTEVWGHSFLVFAPAHGPFLERGPRITMVEALLVPLLWSFNIAGGYTVVGQDLAKWSVSEKTCSGPVFKASLNHLITSTFLHVLVLSTGCTKLKNHVGLSTTLRQRQAVRC